MNKSLDLQSTLSNNRFVGLWRLLSGYRLAYLVASISLVGSALARMGTSYLLRYFVDQALPSQNLLRIVPWIAAGFVALAACEGGLVFLAGRMAAQTGEGIARRLRNYLFDHIQRLSFTYHDRMQTGELLERSTSDVESLRNFFADQVTAVGRILSLFVINFGALLSLNRQLALLSVVVVPIVLVMSLFFFRRVSTAYEAYQDQEAVLSTNLQENLTGVRVVKAFARQDYERDKFDRQNWHKFELGRRLFTLHAFFWPISDTLCGLQTLFAIFLAALRTMDGTLSVGGLVAFMALVLNTIWPMRNLGRLIVQMSSGLVSYSRVMEIVRATREPLDEGDYHPADGVRGEIEFRDVSFGYGRQAAGVAGQTPEVKQGQAPKVEQEQAPNASRGNVLEHINFHCAPGQAVALLGSTGSGKTTLVNLLPRFYDYTEGLLTLDGVDLKRYPRHYLRQQIGIVEQEPFLFSRSIRDNITYGVQRQVTQAEIEAAARAAAIHDDIIGLADGYNTMVGEKGVMLSGGQKQRVAIARTLLKDPRILILDDSTSSVDTETEQEIREALQRLMQGRSSLIIAHRIQSVMNADLILVLDKGHVVQHGTHAELMGQEGIYRRIYDVQASIEVDLQKELAGAGQRMQRTNHGDTEHTEPPW